MITEMKKLILPFLCLAASTFTSGARNSYIFLAPGFEETEALTTVDLLRRARMNVVTVAVADTHNVTGATGITVVADSLLSEIHPEGAEWLIVPGGEPGAQNLHESRKVNDMLINQARHDGGIAAICAGPAIVLAPLKILKGKTATCYPGLQQAITDNGGEYTHGSVVVDGELVTSEGPATTMPFAIEIIRISKGERMAGLIAHSMLKR